MSRADGVCGVSALQPGAPGLSHPMGHGAPWAHAAVEAPSSSRAELYFFLDILPHFGFFFFLLNITEVLLNIIFSFFFIVK